MMDRDILAELERRRRLTKAFGRTTRGTYRQRFPKGFRQSMREHVLKEAARDRPKVTERLLQQRKIPKNERRQMGTMLQQLGGEERHANSSFGCCEGCKKPKQWG